MSSHEEGPGRDGAVQCEPKGGRKGKQCIVGVKIPTEQVKGIAEKRINAEDDLGQRNQHKVGCRKVGHHGKVERSV